MEIKCIDYSIFFVEDFSLLKQTIADFSPSSITILVDKNTEQHCLPLLAIEDANLISIPSGEEHKSLEVCAYIWEKLTDFQVDRKGLLINLGGGVVTDIGGFAASTYKRGIKFINIPTSLLAMVDASVGGKTGIDFKGLKNQIGSFYNPKAIFINPDFLKTLSRRQYYSGMGEMLKHAIIHDKDHWDELYKYLTRGVTTYSVTLDFIFKSVSIKNEIVAQDPMEQNGTRKILNFGHTFGHAIESYFLQPHIPKEQKLLHGEAIGIGMLIEAYLSMARGLYTSRVMEVLVLVTMLYKLPRLNRSIMPQVMFFLNQDKKNVGRLINLVLLKDVGQPLIDVNVEPIEIKDAIDYYNSMSNVRYED